MLIFKVVTSMFGYLCCTRGYQGRVQVCSRHEYQEFTSSVSLVVVHSSGYDTALPPETVTYRADQRGLLDAPKKKSLTEGTIARRFLSTDFTNSTPQFGITQRLQFIIDVFVLSFSWNALC